VDVSSTGTVTATNFIGGSGAFLPLSAGDSYPLTGNLVIEGSAKVLRLKRDANQSWTQYVGSNDDFIIRDETDGRTVFVAEGDGTVYFPGGNVGINETAPAAFLDIQPSASSRKVTRIANDVTSTYFYNAQVDAILAWTCSSYYQAEVVITANQTNGGTTANLYIRGIWSNNHTSHHWDELEHIGSLPGSTFTMSVGQNGSTTNSGRLELDFNYGSGSFSQLNVRVTDFFGSHSYTIT
jgi:hypothetical protein